jgi:hypothetical protein
LGGLSFCRLFESDEGLVPESVEPITQRFDSASIDSVESPSTFNAHDNKSGCFEDLQMLGNGRPAHIHAIRNFPYRKASPAQPLENGSPRGIPQRIQHSLSWTAAHIHFLGFPSLT